MKYWKKLFYMSYFLLGMPLWVHAETFVESITNVLYGTGVNVVVDHTGVSLYIPTDDIFLHRKDPTEPAIDPRYFIILDEVVNVVQNYSHNYDMAITAHTDDLWTSREEKVVAEIYAKELASYLVSRGVDGRRIVKVEGVGSREPVATNRTAGGRMLNRRIEILLIDP